MQLTMRSTVAALLLVCGLAIGGRIVPPVLADSPQVAPAHDVIWLLPVPAPHGTIALLPTDPGIGAPTLGATDLFTNRAEARPVVGSIAVQGPAAGSVVSSLRGENPAGPLNVVASLDSLTCRGGPTEIDVLVYDENGNGVQGAAVAGYVQFSNSGSSLTFPATAAGGTSRLFFNMGSTRGGYMVAFSIHADDTKGNSADTSVGCYAP